MKKLSLIVIVILINLVLKAQVNNQIIDISGTWKFKTGDIPESILPNFDDSNWKDIQVGKNWESQGYPGYDGVGIYRLKVIIPSSFKANQCVNILKVYLGRIDDSDISYFNGKEIGRTNMWNTDRVYAIPMELINWDKENVIVIRAQDDGYDGGGMYAGTYKIERFNKLDKAIELLSDNHLTCYSSVSNLSFTKTVNFKFNVDFNKLPAQIQIKVSNNDTKETTFDKIFDVTLGKTADSSLNYSITLPKQGIYIANYKLYSKYYKDTIYSTAILTYLSGNHSINKVVQPKVEKLITDKEISFDLSRIHLDDYLGNRVDANINERLLKIDETGILEGFYNRPGNQTYVGEYTGKYIHAAARAWQYSKNPQLKLQMDRIVDILLSCQKDDGYLGTYIPENYWTEWDVWAHKYNLLGLLSYYSITGYEPALEASIKIGNLLCRKLGTGPGQINIEETCILTGLPSSSVLEPMTDLYRYTADNKYLDFCNYIIEAYDHEDGPKIISTLNTVGKINKMPCAKAYELLSNFTGIVKLYQLTGNPKLISAMENAWNDITTYRLYITGTSSTFEFFPDDFVLPAENKVHMGEGCVSTSWLQFNQAMYNLTGEAKYIDEMEKTIYNHLLAAENPLTGCISYYTALQGKKPYRCNINGHCCLSSIPRGIAAIPELVYTKNANNGFNINIYSSGKFSDNMKTTNGQLIPVKLAINSRYPEVGSAEISMDIPKKANFNVALRVPVWCKNFVAKVDGKVYNGTPGQYLNIDKMWNKTSKIKVTMDLNVQELDGGMSYPGFVAIKTGPQILAFDQALNPGIDDVSKIEITSSTLQPLPVTELPKDWFGKQIYGNAAIYSGQPVTLKLVPFAEAGQTGGEVRVWLKKR